MYEFVHTGYSELFGANHNSTLTIRLNQANLYIQQGIHYILYTVDFKQQYHTNYLIFLDLHKHISLYS